MSEHAEHYTIVCDNLDIKDIVRQVQAIKKFPCIIKIYDRIFLLDTHEGCYGLAHGLEIGWFLKEESQEKRQQEL